MGGTDNTADKMRPDADTSYQTFPRGSDSTINTVSTIPRIPLNLRQHKTNLAITAAILLAFTCILPIILYYILKYADPSSATVAITVATVVFGAQSVFSMTMRMWSLLKKNPDCKPIGATKRHLDYFQINYLAQFFALTALITVGSILPGDPDPNISKLALPIVSMGLPLIMIITCMQQVIMYIAMTISPTATYPFRFSSMRKGSVIRPASYTIVEDVVAVDGQQGTEYRRLFDERYRFSKDIRALLLWADVAWGFSGVIVGVVLLVIIWAVPDKNVGWVLSWVVPWIWAFAMTYLTVQKTKKACKQENIRYSADKVVYTTDSSVPNQLSP